MSVYPKHKGSELLGLLALSVSVLLSLALISYDALDPSLNVSSPASDYSNWIGRVGAWISDFLFQLVGLSSFLLPLPLLLVGYRGLRGQPLRNGWIKAVGFFLVVAALSTSLSLLQTELWEGVNFTAGGLVGVLLAQILLGYFNAAGSLIVTVTCLAAALIMTTRLSTESVIEWLTRRSWKPVMLIVERLEDWRSQRRKERELALLKKQKRSIVAQSVPRRISLDGQTADQPQPEEPQRPAPEVSPDPVLAVTDSSPPGLVEDWKSGKSVRPAAASQFELPSLDFLQMPLQEMSFDEQQLIETARLLAKKCAEFDVTGRVLQIHPGPVVTTFEFKPDPGVKYSRITNLQDDLCLALKAESVRIDRIPGKSTVGIEVPNSERRTIFLREILSSAPFQQSSSRLTLALGQLINGKSQLTDLSRLPHLLIAGATGSGKSVALNGLVCSILYKATPAEVRFIMVDPKRLELGVYKDIPHLMTPIVTDPKKAANALNWAVREMEERYKVLARYGVRNIGQFNTQIKSEDFKPKSDEDSHLAPLPYIVIIVDELADLMMTAGKDVEAALTRLAQMARAVGIHLILATQRPSVDVLTGLIKANFPSRISFRVSSKTDSRTILDANGGEQLLGMGDMLFLSPSSSRLIRIHGAFISEKEIANITRFLRRQAEPEYREEILAPSQDEEESALVEIEDLEDEIYPEAARFVVEHRKASTSLLQRRFRIGYGRAARILDMLEHENIVGPSEGSKPREVLVPPDYFEKVEENT